MKKSELVFNSILVPLDYLSIVGAAILVFYLRFFNPVIESYPLLYELKFGEYFKMALLLGIFVVVVYAIEGLYSMKVTRSLLKEFIKILSATSVALVIFIIAAFLYRDLFSSRFILLGGWFLIIIFVSLERYLARLIQRRLAREKNIGLHRVLLVGDNDICENMAIFFRKDKKLPYKIVGKMKEADKEKLFEFKNRVDEVIQCDSRMPIQQANLLARFCELNRIDFKYVPNLFAARATNIEIRSLAGFPVVEIKRTPLDGWGRVLKRGIDVAGSLFLIVLLSPLFLTIGIIIKLDSSGPVFVRLRRVSQGKLFRMFKFRSMVKNAQAKKKELMKFNERKDGPLFKMTDDPRITRFGKILRRTRLDEFPQLLNVLVGDMSLAGPRPHEPEEVKKYKTHHRKVLAIKPGITGMAQVSGSSNLSFEEEVGLDTYYIENWSLALDAIILFKTFLVFLRCLTRGDKEAC
jgi:exopolysaccharide biosynthesis polyprenyl glycosylphosphotransferase